MISGGLNKLPGGRGLPEGQRRRRGKPCPERASPDVLTRTLPNGRPAKHTARSTAGLGTHEPLRSIGVVSPESNALTQHSLRRCAGPPRVGSISFTPGRRSLTRVRHDRAGSGWRARSASLPSSQPLPAGNGNRSSRRPRGQAPCVRDLSSFLRRDLAGRGVDGIACLVLQPPP